MSQSQLYLVCAIALLAGRASGADRPPNLMTDPFQVTLGAFFVESEQTMQLDGESERGDRVDWGEKFGGVDARRIRLDGHWRFSNRHKLRVSAFSASRERIKVLEEEIEWGDETYPVNALVNANFNFDILEVAYEYAILRRDGYELNGSFGVHYTTLEASLEARVESSGGTLSEDISETARLEAPLPVIGLGVVWSIPADFWFEASAQFFALSVDDYHGYLEDYRVSLTWQPKAWFGIGFGYNLFALDLDTDKERFRGTLDWSYDGPLLFYRASF